MPLDAQPFAGLPLIANVHFAGRVIADQHGRQARNNAIVLDELGNLFGQLGLNLPG